MNLNPNIITHNFKTNLALSMYYSPLILGTVYCFLARAEPWPSEDYPPIPTEDTASIKYLLNNVFVVKKLNANDISPVLQRVDWTSGTTYDYYNDNYNLFIQNDNGSNAYNFYIKNQYDQVFKCLWNNNGQPSTVEPFFEPGSYNTYNIYTGSDGYKWKYMYTIDIGNKVKFMDTDWMPVPIGTNVPNPVTSVYGKGSIDAINIISGGSNYSAPIVVKVDGDGTGLVASAKVTDGKITDVTITNPGKNYTYANVTITSANTTNLAIAISPTSPIGGHGFDPVSELGCSHVMFTSEFNGNEGGVIPTDIDYHQLGLVFSPTTLADAPNYANGSIYSTTTDIVVSPGRGIYIPDEIVFQGTGATPTLDSAYFSGRVLSFNTSTNTIKVLNIKGTPITNQTIYGYSSTAQRTFLSYTSPSFQTLSGYVIAIVNRSPIQRSSDGVEQFKYVVGF
jgi:hypothetical protein